MKISFDPAKGTWLYEMSIAECATVAASARATSRKLPPVLADKLFLESVYQVTKEVGENGGTKEFLWRCNANQSKRRQKRN